MEKTILYSKKASSINFNIKKYQACQHEHCKELVSHIKFLSNTLTQKIFKEQLNSIKNASCKQKQNIIDDKIKNSLLNKTLEEQIQNIRKNYTKLRKQLNQIEVQNDELFQENQNLKKKIEKLQQNLSNKQNFQLSLTKCNESTVFNSNSQSKSQSFYNGKGQPQHEPKNHHILTQQTLQQLNIKFQGTITSDYKHLSTDRQEIYNKYQKLMKDYKVIERDLSNNQQKIVEYEYLNKKLEYENNQLKKIIKLRNEIQNSRHHMINHLKNVLDEIEA